MRNFFTRILMIVFLFGIIYQGYGLAQPPLGGPDPLPPGVDVRFPEDNSTTDALPDMGGVFEYVLELSSDLNAVQPFGNGIVSLSKETAPLAYQQLETIQLPDARVTWNGNVVTIVFNTSLAEDGVYHITVSEGNAFRFENGDWFEGVEYQEWNFTAKDVTKPMVEDCGTVNDVNGDFNVDIDLEPIEFCLDELVMWNPDGPNPMDIGNIAFYLATKSDLQPNDEFGGDALYSVPAYVEAYDDYGLVWSSMAPPPAPDFQEGPLRTPMFNKLRVYPKDIGEYDDLKSAAIGPHVWPVDRDMYMRFAADMLIDKGGNTFDGFNGSPKDPYSISGSMYWFSTRADLPILTSATAVADPSGSFRTAPQPIQTELLWETDDIVVNIATSPLVFISNGAAVSASNVSQFIKLSIDGVDVPFTASISGGTNIRIEPGNLPEEKTLKVDIIGGLIRDANDLRVVAANTFNFEIGDFTAPDIDGKVTIENTLCTNFDIRVTPADKPGHVYYAIVKLDDDGALPTYWNLQEVTREEIMEGYREIYVNSTVGTVTLKFYHVQDTANLGSATVPPYVYGPNNLLDWRADGFNISSSLIAHEKVDDFTEENHGDRYMVYYFSNDANAEGPYTDPTVMPGRSSDVMSTEVTHKIMGEEFAGLTDCVAPEIVWFYQDNINDGNEWTACESGYMPPILKDGSWDLNFITGGKVEGLHLVNSSLTWDDVITLEIANPMFAPRSSWPFEEVDATITPMSDNGEVVNVMVSPLNSYPSRGNVRITLASGTVMDAAGNVINSELVCTKQVNAYDDPWVQTFRPTSTKALQFPNEPGLENANGIVATISSPISIQFNNPMYTPAKDETVPGTLEAIELNDTAAANYIGKYVKLRVGNADTAMITDDIVSANPFTFSVVKDANGGITVITATPKVPYLSENWYYVEVEKELLDENRRELSYTDANSNVWDNNLFVDLHQLHTPYPVSNMGAAPFTPIGNSDRYNMIFRTEDAIAPELRWVFNKFTPQAGAPIDPDYGPGNWETFPYIAGINEDYVYCAQYDGLGDGVPVGAIINEWSEMGFDNADYYINEDPNGLRPYFTMKDAGGNPVLFDVVVLHVYTPEAIPGAEYPGYDVDAVWFGFIPQVPAGEGETYTMEFNPQANLGNTGYANGPIFVDDNGNALIEDTYVEFTTCAQYDDSCIDAVVSVETTTIGSKDVVDGFMPVVTIDFDEAVAPNQTQTWKKVVILEKGDDISTDPQWVVRDNNATSLTYSGSELTINWTAWNPENGAPAQLEADKEYTVVLRDWNSDTGPFVDVATSIRQNCTASVDFWTNDTIAPMAVYFSPDSVSGDIGNNTNLTSVIDPRNPGIITIGWDEDVVENDPNVTLELWQNGTTLRKVYKFSDGTLASNMWSAELPKDFLQYESNFHIDVKQGFVKDIAGNTSASVTGNAQTDSTWTFETGSDTAPEIVDWTPKCTVEPGVDYTIMTADGDVQINKITLTISETAVPVAGKKLFVRTSPGTGIDLLAIDVADMTSSDNVVWTYTLAAGELVLPYTDSYNIYVEDSAFVQDWPANSTLATPDYTGVNYLVCDETDPLNGNASFAFDDLKPPTVTIWPVDGDDHVSFTAHGYIKIDEQVMGYMGSNPPLVLTQANIKNWVKVTKDDGTGTMVAMDPSEYVCEFVNLERTHIRVTFLDEEAPAIDGVTASMKDEWMYNIEVKSLGDNGYTLRDWAGNDLVDDDASFETEDITPPVLFTQVCTQTASSVTVKFVPQVNVDPYGNGRDYPAEGGTVYYVVRPTGSAVTADDLFNKVWTDVGEKVITSAGASVTINVGNIDNTTGYNYTVYAVMKDAEVDVYVPTGFGGAWPTTETIFVQAGDTDPLQGAVGLADIRPAPNYSYEVAEWNFCFCDNDLPIVETKDYNGETDVPVDATFEITFDELIQFSAGVDPDGMGTGGDLGDAEYGYEVRLREWNNNVAIDATIALNVAGDGFIITPDSPLKEETKYYIEIDRWVVMDIPGSNCMKHANPDPVDPDCIVGCSDEPNYFPGWIGRDMWNFTTRDNTPPVLVDVAPKGTCVDVDPGQIVFTFTEKNDMQIMPLAGQSQSIYIYKEGDTNPYEIINASSGVKSYGGGDTIRFTFNRLHTLADITNYFVVWDTLLFADNAVLPNSYVVGGAATAEVSFYNYPAAPTTPSDWHQFGFTSEDNIMPVASWSFLNRLWANADNGQGGTFNDTTVYRMAQDDYDLGDVLSESTDVCSVYESPNQVGMVVWFDKTIVDNGLYIDDEDYFYFRTASGSNVTFNVVDKGVGAYTFPTMDGGIDIPAGSQWFEIQTVGDLASVQDYVFGLNPYMWKDEACTPNVLTQATELFSFCTWDGEEAEMTLYDGIDVEIMDEDSCVAEMPYIIVEFDKVMRKTSTVVVPPQFGAPILGAPWWTYDNLILKAEDFMDNGADNQIYQLLGPEGFPVISSVETLEAGRKFKLMLLNPLVSYGEYTFTLREDVVKDVVREPNGNLFPGAVIDFTVNDWTAPLIAGTAPQYMAGLSPYNTEVNVSPSTNLAITFNKEVQLGTSARIIVRDNASQGGLGVVANFRADDPEVSLSVDMMTVNVNIPTLAEYTRYYVEIQDSFVYNYDCKMVPFEGRTEQGDLLGPWYFDTSDETGPIAELMPAPATECVGIDENLVMTFNENITIMPCSQVAIYKVRDGETWHGELFGDIVQIIPLFDNYPQVSVTGSDVANGLNQNVVTVIVPVGLWESGATYYVRVLGNGHDCATESSVIEDVNGNTWEYPVPHEWMTLLPGIHHNQWYFTIGDVTPPSLATTVPVRNGLVPAGVASATTDLVMNFVDEVALGVGTIEVFEFIENPEGGIGNQTAVPVRTFNVPEDVTLSADMKTVTVSSVELLDGIHWYYVIVSSGAITNNVECTLTAWGGIDDPDGWLFSTAPDVTDPELDDSAITSDACSETYLNPATVMFELTFSEGVSVANGTGLVEIREVGGAVVSTVTITADMIDGNVITIMAADLSNDLEDQKQYEVVIAGDAIHDLATASLTGTQNPQGLVPSGNENWFAGVVLPFETGDFTQPMFVSGMPVAIDLENDVMLVATFDEAVQDGAGLLKLYNAETDELVATFDAANDEDAVAETVTFSVNLPDETSYYVLIDEGFVMDMRYMDSCDDPRPNVAVTDPAVWTFAIDDNTIPEITADLTEDADNLDMTFDIVLQYNDTLTAVDASLAQLTYLGGDVAGVTGAVLGVDPTQVVVSVTVANDQREYMLELGAGFVLDDAINANASLDTIVGPYVVGDRTDPIRVANSPLGILGSYHTPPVILKLQMFDDSELTVEGPIIITNSLGVEVLQWTPDLSGDQYDELDISELLWFDTYTVTIGDDVIVDADGNYYKGSLDGNWNFSIIDNTDPNCLEATTPADGDCGVKKDIDLVLEFCERMAPGAEGKYIRIFDMLEVQGQLQLNELFAAIQVTADMIDKKVVTIPVAGLADLTSYIVMADADALRDEAGNSWEGISNPTTWNFTTGDNTAPEATINTSLLEVDNVEYSFEVPVNFTEAVQNVSESTITVTTTGDNVDYTVTLSADMMTATVAVSGVAQGDTLMLAVTTAITDIVNELCQAPNMLLAEVSQMFVVGDHTAPEIMTVWEPTEPDNTENSFMVTVEFTEEVKGVDAAVTVTGAVKDSVTTADGITYMIYVTGEDFADVTVDIANTITDVSVNENVLVEGWNGMYTVGDHVAPMIESVVPAEDLKAKNETMVDITFSEAVMGLELGLTVNGMPAMVIDTVGNTYTVKVAGADHDTLILAATAAITDVSKNMNPLANPGEWTYIVTDNTGPQIVTVDPYMATDTINTFDVTIAFDEDVIIPDGAISVDGDASVTAHTWIVEESVLSVTISAPDKTTVTLSLDTTITDQSENLNPFAGASYTYSIGDHMSPELDSMAPNGFLGDVKTVDLVLYFNEDVEFGPGSVHMYKADGSGLEISLPATASTIDGGMVTFADVEVAKATEYFVIVDAGAFNDLAGNAFGGMNDIEAWTFSIGDFAIEATIKEIQGDGDKTPLEGETVIVDATVTAIAAGEGFFMQDENAAWGGIWVEYSDVSSSGIQIGNGVHVKGTATEVANVTSIINAEVSIVAPMLVVVPIEVASPSAIDDEMYESVLTQVVGARATAAESNGEWTIYYEASDDATVNDWLFGYEPTEGLYYSVTGVVNGRLDNFRLEPRMNDDITVLTDAEITPSVEFNVYPNPFNDRLLIDNSDRLTRVVLHNIAGQKVIDVAYPDREIRTANLVSGVYVISLITEDGIAKTERIVKR